MHSQARWFAEDSRHVRLVLPAHPNDPRIARRAAQLKWLHTTESLCRLKKKVVSGEWRVQRVTISFVGGHWQASFSIRQFETPVIAPRKLLGRVVGLDLGVKHLATLSVPVAELSDLHGHIANPRHLKVDLEQLAQLDRQLARCMKGFEESGETCASSTATSRSDRTNSPPPSEPLNLDTRG